MHAIDISLFYSVYNYSGHSAWTDWLIVFVGEDLIYLILLAFVIDIAREFRKKRRNNAWTLIETISGALVALLVTAGIRLVYPRLRPFLALGLTQHVLTDYAYSFPSAHTIFLFALATGIYRVNKRVGLGLYILALLVGLARIAGGVHYPSDIIGGAVLGILVSITVTKVWEKLASAKILPPLEPSSKVQRSKL